MCHHLQRPHSQRQSERSLFKVDREALCLRKETELGVVAHIYNPIYLGGKDWEDCSLRPAWVKNEIPSQQISQVLHACDPSYM
jgi:hypothetical protein